MEPFQIFVFRTRSDVTQQNPELTNSEITSLLGRMWRSLPQSEKDDYMRLAIHITADRRPIRKRHRKSKPPKPDTVVETSTDDVRLLPGPPQFRIVPRGTFGALAANASGQVFCGQQPENA
jgi:hypothetical protein